MECLQYEYKEYEHGVSDTGFKPYYNWNTFNTMKKVLVVMNHNLTF